VLNGSLHDAKVLFLRLCAFDVTGITIVFKIVTLVVYGVEMAI